MLKLLLDEHMPRVVARELRRRDIAALTLSEWEGGAFLGMDDAAFLEPAAAAGLTLVTYDVRTIPTLLREWADTGRHHAGGILVNAKTLPANDVGGLVQVLRRVVADRGDWDWTDRVVFLQL